MKRMKVVVVMKNWLGDLLFQMPALDLIRKKYPGASIACVAPERCREILEAHPAVSGFLSFDEKSTHRSWLARIRFVLELRRRGPWDRGYLFHRSRSRAVLLALAGVKERIGYGKGRKAFLSRAIEEPARPMHQLDYFLNMMQGAGFELPAEKEYRFFYKEENEQAARDKNYTHGDALYYPNHEYMTGGFSSIFMSRNRVRDWNEPSFTIQASGRHTPIHPKAPKMVLIAPDKRIFVQGKEDLYRRLSIRECARIQSFPDNFLFQYTKLEDGYKMVGNAVPVEFAKHLASVIYNDVSDYLLSVNRELMAICA